MRNTLKKILFSFAPFLLLLPNILFATLEDAREIIPIIQLLLLSEDSDPKGNEILTNPIINKVKNTNFKNLLKSTDKLSKSNYIAYYKRMSALKFVSIPSLKVTFDLKKAKYKAAQSKNINRYDKVIYENIWSRKDEAACQNGGTISKEVSLFPRGRFEADTYKTGDNTIYDYYGCNMGAFTYNGKVEYRVGNSNSNVNEINFDYSFGPTPLGTFDSQFNNFSIETALQKVTLNGNIRYDAKSARTPEPNSKLLSLEKTYYTVGDFVITVYDKTTGETTKLVYKGTLEKVVYRERGGVSNSDASVIDLGVIGKFTYRKTSNYSLRVERNETLFTLEMHENNSGLMGNNGYMNPPRPIGYDFTNASYLNVSNHTINHITLVDGTSRYILDMNADWHSEANIVEGSPKHTLPPSNVNLMQGVVVIGFDTCPPTNRLRKHLEDLGVPYNYINMQGTQEAYNVFKWFSIIGVPYIGVNGNFFGAASYSKNLLTMHLNRQGYNLGDASVKQARSDVRGRSAAVYFEERFEYLQNKERHTAMAVANDVPYRYTTYRVWNRSTAQKAIEHALEKCEERRKARVDNGKKEIISQCRLYSVDGVKQASSSLRSLPE